MLAEIIVPSPLRFHAASMGY